MKKLFILFLFLLLSCFQCFAENIVLPSETGIVRELSFDDTANIQETQAPKQIALIEVLSGEYKGTKRYIDNMLTGNPAYDIPLKKGDKVVLHLEPKNENIITADDIDFFVADIKRENAIWIFTAIFGILLLITGKKKGITSIISIIATVLLIFFALVPIILSGISPLVASVIIGILSTIITLYLVGGFNPKSTSAVLGTSISLIFSGLLALLAINIAHLTGFAGEENMFLYTARPDLDFTGILAASIIIAALGALMDTSVSIASTINEIHETDKSLSIASLFKSGMNVGKDIIGTMSNTLILVYMGSSLPLILLSSNIDLNKFFNLNQVATEIISALIGSIAILVCVPATAVIASYLIKKSKNNYNFNFDKTDKE